MMYAESPEEGTSCHRGWDVPAVKGWRRKRNYVIGATSLITPSRHARPLSAKETGQRPGKCASPGCGFFAHSALSVGNGTHCCQKCHDKGSGKHHHSGFCERLPVSGPPPEWSLPLHGCVDFELFISMKIPIPTFLIPLTFARWVMVKLVRCLAQCKAASHALSWTQCTHRNRALAQRH